MSMDMDMQHGLLDGIVALFEQFLVTFYHFYNPPLIQAADDGRHDLLLCLYPKEYLKTAAFTLKMMRKGRPCKIFRHQRRYLEALGRFFDRGQNTARTLYVRAAVT
jgi:hypothetical protein